MRLCIQLYKTILNNNNIGKKIRDQALTHTHNNNNSLEIYVSPHTIHL